jgi:hypothetical protein
VRASPREKTRTLPGDELIARPIGAFTHAITIRGRARDVWPWLVQMGAGSRAGWYSYDRLDNARRPSATRIVANLQHVTVGTIFPALPGIRDAFTVLAVQPERALILGWSLPGGTPLMTWAFVLEETGPDSTRLIVRARGAPGYHFFGIPWRLSAPIVRLVHFIMQRRQLLGIAGRVEAAPPARRDTAARSA